MSASITELDITPGNSEDEAVLIVVWSGDASLVEIDWGDGNKESVLADGDRLAIRHDYAGKPGTHSINVSVHGDSEIPSTGVIIIDVVDKDEYEASRNYLHSKDYKAFATFTGSASAVATGSASAGSVITYNESVADIAKADVTVANDAAGYLEATADAMATAVATVSGEIDHTSIFVVADEPDCEFGNTPFNEIVPEP